MLWLARVKWVPALHYTTVCMPSSKDDQTGKAGKTSIGFTGVMTHDRFSPFSTVKDFKPKDIISIGKWQLCVYVSVYDSVLLCLYVSVQRRICTLKGILYSKPSTEIKVCAPIFILLTQVLKGLCWAMSRLLFLNCCARNMSQSEGERMKVIPCDNFILVCPFCSY